MTTPSRIFTGMALPSAPARRGVFCVGGCARAAFGGGKTGDRIDANFTRAERYAHRLEVERRER